MQQIKQCSLDKQKCHIKTGTFKRAITALMYQFVCAERKRTEQNLSNAGTPNYQSKQQMNVINLKIICKRYYNPQSKKH